MGVIRKFTSISTVGLVDFRSDKERIARSTRQTKKAVKSQTRQQKRMGQAGMAQQAGIALAQQQMAAQQAALAQQQVHLAAAQLAGQSVSVAPPGWYPDPSGAPAMLRWWDGAQWTQTMPAPPAPGAIAPLPPTPPALEPR